LADGGSVMCCVRFGENSFQVELQFESVECLDRQCCCPCWADAVYRQRHSSVAWYL